AGGRDQHALVDVAEGVVVDPDVRVGAGGRVVAVDEAFNGGALDAGPFFPVLNDRAAGRGLDVSARSERQQRDGGQAEDQGQDGAAWGHWGILRASGGLLAGVRARAAASAPIDD